MKHHVQFRNFHRGVTKATEELFESRPWSGTPDEKDAKFNRWLRKASSAYGVQQPTLEIMQTSAMEVARGTYGHNVIRLYHHSVVTLFHEFRHHMQQSGLVADLYLEDYEACEIDARNWSCSLFYSLRPAKFRRSVRAGKILFVHPRDLLANPDEWVEPLTDQASFDRQFDEMMNNLMVATEAPPVTETDEGDEDGDR